MPRGARKDQFVTALLFKNGLFQDRKSFVSLDTKLFLAGDDWTAQKVRVWKRDKYTCQIGKHPLDDSAIADPDHIVKKSKGGDDSLSNLRTVCREHHNERHPEKRLHFTQGLNAAYADRKAEAHKEFDRINPSEEQ